MPELPEVEHIVRYLTPHIVSKRIKAIELLDAKARRRPPWDETCSLEALVGYARAQRRRDFGMLGQQCPLIGVLAQHLYRPRPTGCGWCRCPHPIGWRPA